MSGVKCDSCGMFRASGDIIGTGDGNEEWTECVFCTSDSELEWHKKERKYGREKPEPRDSNELY